MWIYADVLIYGFVWIYAHKDHIHYSLKFIVLRCIIESYLWRCAEVNWRQ